MDVKKLQTNLVKAGYQLGTVDGDLGPKTYAALLSYTVGRDLGSLGLLLGRAMAADFPKYSIVTPNRIANFIAQSAHETGGFRRFVEMGNGDGPDADPWDDYLQKYDFRADLGNSAGGDGEKYRGRGIFQLTGKANYKKYGARMGIDLLNQPARAAEPEIAVLTACLYWTDRGINVPADAGDVTGVTKKINGGVNGLAERKTYTTKALGVF